MSFDTELLDSLTDTSCKHVCTPMRNVYIYIIYELVGHSKSCSQFGIGAGCVIQVSDMRHGYMIEAGYLWVVE